MFGPAFLRNGLSALLIVYRSIEAATPYRIDVTPGTTTVPRGSDQQIKAKLFGFKSADAEVRMRSGSEGAWERVPLVPTADPLVFEGILFHLEKPIDYRVIANGVESKLFTMTLVDLPTVSKMELEYRYPAYTGLPPQKIENGGDVAALRGTEVFLHITPSMNTPSGKILVNESESRPLTRQADGSLTGSFTIDKQGFYRIELEGPHGEQVTASPQYTIDVTADRAPTVSFLKPGRDTMATAVEELFVEAKASDDFGVKQLELFYAVNGGKEKTVKLFGGAKPLTEVSAGHTIYLEELGLVAGRFGLLLRASHRHRFGPDRQDRVERHLLRADPAVPQGLQAGAVAGAGGGGGGGGGNDVGQLSQQQKEIVAATFNVIRDKAKISAEKYRENVVFLTLSQGKLETQVEELIEKMRSRSGRSGRAVQEDRRRCCRRRLAGDGDRRSHLNAQAGSEDRDDARAGGAEDICRRPSRNTRCSSPSSRAAAGAAAAASSRPNDLADLFELELDKLANQYEMQKRAGEQQGRAEDGRARRQAEGARAAPAAGGRAAAADGGRRTRARRAAAPSQRQLARGRRKKRRGGSSSSRATCRGRTCSDRRGSCRTRRTRCGARRPTDRATAARRRSRRSTSCARRPSS